MSSLFQYLDLFEDSLWCYLGFPAIIGIGIYLTYASKFVQIRNFPQVVRHFVNMLTQKGPKDGAVHPIHTFFACIGGCVGIGNIVGVTTAVQLGGPGAVFWIWIAAMVGSLVKYAEVALGMKYREKRADGGYNGGPMYVLKKAFPKLQWPVTLFCILMCLYGVEVFQFSAMASSVSMNFDIPKVYVALFFLALVLIAESGGIKRIGAISSTLIPAFIVVYLSMGIYVIAMNWAALPGVVGQILAHAFTPAAPVGAFAGASLMMAMSQGIKRACYSCDIGVGYASIIHSESAETSPARQASLTIFEVFLDTFVICTMSMVIVLVTSTWQQPVEAAFLVQNALSAYFPYMNYFMPAMLFLLGYSTIIAYFAAGMRTAIALFPKLGRPLYYAYSVIMLVTFSFVDLTQANTVMSVVLAMLLLLNISAIVRLRKEIDFDFASEIAPAGHPATATD